MSEEIQVRTDDLGGEFDERKPWDRLEGEPMLWYARFEKFRLTGTTRSLTGLYNYYRKGQKKAVSAPVTWRKAAVLWHWRERAEKSDLFDLEEQRRKEAKAREDEHNARVTVLQAYRGKIIEAMKQLQPDDATWNEVTGALRVVTQELRAEFNDLPTERNEVTGTLSVLDLEATRRRRWQQLGTILGDALTEDDSESDDDDTPAPAPIPTPEGEAE